jgi:hypothetical protein
MSGMPGIRLKFRIGSSSNLTILPGELAVLSDDSSIRLNTTQTSLSASNASVLVGTIGSAGATGAQGAQGHTGAEGYVGDDGFTGAQGTEGFMGSTGPQGETGATGDQGSTGDTGAQGITGVQGSTGTQGIQGETGSQGETGFMGAQGEIGFTGAQGATGSIGAQGSTGSTGAQGFTGADGDIGSTGAQGITGSSGAQGFLGSTGIDGIEGSTGAQGDTGAQGSTGLPGVQGTTGIDGVQGATGFTGAQGDTGAQGSTGATGSQGSTGVQGDTGEEGAQGDTGAQGSQGDTGAQGTQGATGSQGLDGFTGAQGSTGFTGTQGYTGAEGATGSTGAQGSTGAEGSQGSTGAQGSQGSTGAQGATGSTGAQGSTGATGVQGDTGAQGSTGSTGAQGSTGTQGETGAQGAQGDTGAQGSTGSTGAQGFTGSTGAEGFTGAQGVTGWTGAQGATGSQGSIGWTGAQGSTGFTGAQGATGAQGSQGSTGAQGSTGSTGAQGATGARGVLGWTGAQGFTGSTGAQGSTGPTGLAGAAGSVLTIPLTNQTAYTVGSTGGAYTYNSNISFSSNTLTVTNAVTSNLSAVTMISQPTSVIPITYLTSSNAGIARSLYMIKNSPSSFALIPGTPSNIFSSNIILTQLIVHPSGWVYAYCDSLNGTASNYMYIGAVSNIASGLTLSNFGSAVNHMALDPLGSIFISYNTASNISKYTVNPSTGALTQVSTLVAPFAQGKVYATTGYLYVYLSGTTSNIYEYYNIPGSIGSLVSTFASNIYGNDGTLRFLSANANDTVLYLTTSTSNLYAYSLQYSTATKIESNLAAAGHTPSVDSYANALYTSLTNSNIVRISALDGSYRSNVGLSLLIGDPSGTLSNSASIVYNSLDFNTYFVSSNSIQKLTPTGAVTLFAGNRTSSGSTDATGSAARFNSPSQICLDPSGSNLYVADTGNNSIRQIVISTAAVTTAKTSLTTIRGLACDSSNLYFSLANSTIQRTTITGGTTSTAVTVVGLANTSGSVDAIGTSARVGNNCSLFFDSINTNLFVADTANFTLRILNKVSSNIKTVYGTAGQSGDTTSNINTVRALTFGANGVLTFADSGVNKIKSTSLPRTNPTILTDLYSTNIPRTGLVVQSGSPITSSIVYYVDSAGLSSNQFYSIDLSTTNQPTLFRSFTGQGTSTSDTLCVDNKSNFYFNHTLGLCSYNYGTLVFSNLSSQPRPGTLTIDSTFSNIYYFTNYVVYKYDLSTRTNTAIAGSNGVGGYIDGTGTAARFAAFGSRMCVDASNQFVYMYESGSFVLRKIQLSTGTVSTLAGLISTPGMLDGIGGTARLRNIGGMHLGKSGLIYFIDDYVAENNPPREAVLRIADTITSNITCITPSNIRFLPGFYAERIALNESETIMYSCYSFSKFSATAIPRLIQTVAGSGTAGSNNATGLSATFSNPQGITFNGSNLIVADTGNNTLRQITSNYVVTSTGSLSVVINNPQTVSLYSNSLYTVMNSNTTSAIVRIPLTYPSTTFTFSNLTYFTDIVFSKEYNFNGASFILINPVNSNIYVYVGADYRFFMITPSGTATIIAGTGGYGNLDSAIGVNARFQVVGGCAINSTATTIYAWDNTDYIRMIDLRPGSNYAVTRSTNAFSLALYFGMCIDPTNSFLYGAGNGGGGGIYKINISNWTYTTLANLPSIALAGICINSLGTILYYTSVDTRGGIGMYTLSTSTSTLIAGSTTQRGFIDANGTTARFSSPYYLTIDSLSENLYVADFENSSIRRIELTSGNYKVDTISGLYASPIGSTLYLPNDYKGIGYNQFTQSILYADKTSKSIIQTLYASKRIQVQNATGRQVTVAVTGGTVTNSNLPSIANISDIKTLYNTTGTTYTLY